jgi:hypothetical protein
MSESTIRTAIYNVVNGVTNIGKVYDYDRWAADWNTFINLFKTTIGGVDQIRGWEISRRSAGERPSEFGPVNEESHLFVVRGYMAINDAAATEKTFNALIEAVGAAFRSNQTLSGTAHRHDFIQAEIIEARTFGSVLCHYCELALTVHERT